MSQQTTPPTSTIETVEVTGPDAEARGHNGWFRLQSVQVQRFNAEHTITHALRTECTAVRKDASHLAPEKNLRTLDRYR